VRVSNSLSSSPSTGIAPRASAWRNTLVASALIAPAAVYYGVVAAVSVNLPFWDDFGVFLIFLIKIKIAPTFWKEIEAVVSVHNEHRLIFSRLVGLAQFWLCKELNFLALIAIGNLALLALAGILWRRFRLLGLPAPYFLPIPYILFSFCSWENMAWATCALQHSFFALFASLALLKLAELDERPRLGYLIFFLLACASSGGGVCLIPVVWLYLLATRNWRNLVLFSALALLVAVAYYDSSRAIHQPHTRDLLAHPQRLVLFTLAFLGNATSNPTSALALGTLVLGWWAHCLATKRFAQHKEAILFVSLTLSIAVTAAAFRSEGGLQRAMDSKYTINTSVMLAFVALSLLRALQGRARRAFVVILSVVAILGFFAQAYVFSHTLFSNKRDYQRDAALYARGNGEEMKRLSWRPDKMRVLYFAELFSIYKMPPSP
jgi:hypothetical protein